MEFRPSGKGFLSLCMHIMPLTSILLGGCPGDYEYSYIPPDSQFEQALVTGVLNPTYEPGLRFTAQWTGDTLQTTAVIHNDTAAKQQEFSLFVIGVTADSGGKFILRQVDSLLLILHAPFNSFVPGRFKVGLYETSFDFDLSYYYQGRVYRSISSKLGYASVGYLSDSVIQGSFDYIKTVNQLDTMELDGGFRVHYRKL